MQRSNKLCRIFVVRHGETEWNVQERCQGQMDSFLTSKGLAQAQELADQFRGESFAAVFASDLSRARRTAEIIAKEHELAVATKEALRERNFGKFQGKLWSEWKDDVQEKLESYRKMVGEDRFRHRLDEGVETDEEMVSRFINFLREIAVAYVGKQVLIVSHGGMMRTVLVHLGYGSEEELIFGAIQNLGYFVLESDGVDFFVGETVGINKKKL